MADAESRTAISTHKADWTMRKILLFDINLLLFVVSGLKTACAV